MPFYIPVDEGVTHREVQRMVWHRVKFIAWVRMLPNLSDTGEDRYSPKSILLASRSGFGNPEPCTPIPEFSSEGRHTFQQTLKPTFSRHRLYICVGRQSVEFWENRKAEVAKGVVKSVCYNYQSYLATQA